VPAAVAPAPGEPDAPAAVVGFDPELDPPLGLLSSLPPHAARNAALPDSSAAPLNSRRRPTRPPDHPPPVTPSFRRTVSPLPCVRAGARSGPALLVTRTAVGPHRAGSPHRRRCPMPRIRTGGCPRIP